VQCLTKSIEPSTNCLLFCAKKEICRDIRSLLWHVHNEVEILIGVYATNADAVAAKERLRQKLGFVDTPEGFEIHEYQLNQDHWTEGYACV